MIDLRYGDIVQTAGMEITQFLIIHNDSQYAYGLPLGINASKQKHIIPINRQSIVKVIKSLNEEEMQKYQKMIDDAFIKLGIVG